MISRTWALIAWAIVLCPGIVNMINLEYLASLEDMSSVHDLAWDEHLLSRAMEEAPVFQEKKRMQATMENPGEFQIPLCLPMLAIIYMDHLDIPVSLPNQHVIDYSVPKIHFVCQKDFDWVDRVDKNKLTLVQPFYGKHIQFRLPCNIPYAAQLVGQEVGTEAASGQGSQIQGTCNCVPSQFQMLYDKHVEIFAAEVDDVVGKFAKGLKGLQCNRMANLLHDVGHAIAATDEPTISFATPSMDEGREEESNAQVETAGIDAQAQVQAATPSMNKDQVIGELKKNQEVTTDAGQTREQQRVSFEMEGNISPQSPPLFYDAPRSATAGIWDDEPSCELFPKGSNDYDLIHYTEEPTIKKSAASPIYTNISVFPVSDDDDSPIPTTVATDDQMIDVRSGPSTHDKNTRKKRMAKVPAVKIPSQRSRRTSFGKIGGFYIGYKKFLVCFKPRGDMNDEVMSLCIEMFNLASYAKSNKAVKKFMFSVHGAQSLLKQGPSTFQPSVVMPELERAVTGYKVKKFDLLFFMIVHEHHWIDVCATLLHKQWNVFDSINAKGKVSPLKRQANNLITNFATLTQECDEFNVNVASFPRVDLEDYPKQNNMCDCSFFGFKYAENFDGKAVREFKKKDMARYRKDLAYSLFTHPLNNAPKEVCIQ